MLTLDITNNDVTSSLDALAIDWNVGVAIRILDQHLGGLTPSELIGNANETSSPSIFPVPNPFTGLPAAREIASGVTKTLYTDFQVAPTGSGYTIDVHFDIGCKVSASIP